MTNGRLTPSSLLPASPLLRQEAKKTAQIASGKDDWEDFEMVFAFVYQAISIVTHQMTMIPLSIRDAAPRSESVQEISRFRPRVPLRGHPRTSSKLLLNVVSSIIHCAVG